MRTPVQKEEGDGFFLKHINCKGISCHSKRTNVRFFAEQLCTVRWRKKGAGVCGV